MPSFDIISKVDPQLLDNTINTTKKEILNRYDFKGLTSELDYDPKANTITFTVDNDMQLKAMVDILLGRASKQNVDVKSFGLDKEPYASGKHLKKEISIKQGIDKEASKKIISAIKESKIKVEAQIMGDQIRVSSKKIDDLQAVMALIRKSDFGIALRFDNMRS